METLPHFYEADYIRDDGTLVSGAFAMEMVASISEFDPSDKPDDDGKFWSIKYPGVIVTLRNNDIFFVYENYLRTKAEDGVNPVQWLINDMKHEWKNDINDSGEHTNEVDDIHQTLQSYSEKHPDELPRLYLRKFETAGFNTVAELVSEENIYKYRNVGSKSRLIANRLKKKFLG